MKPYTVIRRAVLTEEEVGALYTLIRRAIQENREKGLSDRGEETDVLFSAQAALDAAVIVRIDHVTH